MRGDGETESERWSYRADPRVPPFQEDVAVVVLDGACALCSFGARLIARFDRRRVAETCGGLGRLLSVFWILPRPARDWIYRRVARNRIALFGRADICALPDPRLKARLIGVR